MYDPNTMVSTAIGMVKVGDLQVTDIIDWTPDARTLATEWRLKSTGTLVKRDVVVNLLRPAATGITQGMPNG